MRTGSLGRARFISFKTFQSAFVLAS